MDRQAGSMGACLQLFKGAELGGAREQQRWLACLPAAALGPGRSPRKPQEAALEREAAASHCQHPLVADMALNACAVEARAAWGQHLRRQRFKG